MSLSTGTLNLKFMQRAAAKSSSSSTSTTALASTSLTPGVEPSNQSSNGLTWTLPRSRPKLRLGVVKTEVAVDEGRVRFESSYLPFLGKASGNRGEGSSRGGGGRMAFGGFGEEEEEEEEVVVEGDENGEVGREGRDRNGEDKEVGAARRKRKGDDREDDHKWKAVEHGVPGSFKRLRPPRSPLPTASPQPPASSSSKSFIRPAGFSSPPPPPPQPSLHPLPPPIDPPRRGAEPGLPERKISTADRLRQTISTSRATKPNDMVHRPASKPDVARPSPSTATREPPVTHGLKHTKPDLDGRERELKAQRKREKNARKQARKAAVAQADAGDA